MPQVASAQSVATTANRPAPEVAAKKTIVVDLAQFKVIKNADGAEQLVSAASVKPGDIIEYKATYTNTSNKPVTGLVADLPIPDGLEYQAHSAKPGAVLAKAATKDGIYAAEPLTRKVAGNKTEPVPYNEYRAMRWALGQLPAGGVTAVTVRAKVEVVTPPAPKTTAGAAQAPPVTVRPVASQS
ncbi:putative signal peptide protein [Collimonas arenae]|uniref:Putative signal peptide protein n=2 Tax=Collimonas arenae TaxID=279058 RepID=A0A0A1FGP7_9BURK|nr:putative signal peptide protein [Collimonas arenae]